MPYPTQPTASHFIDGTYVEDTSGGPIDVIYPATGAVIVRVYAATPAIIEQALAAAERAQKAWAGRMVEGFQAGTCFINTYNLAPVEVLFGGMKASGVGRENSKAAIQHYSQLKSVYVAMTPCVAPY